MTCKGWLEVDDEANLDTSEVLRSDCLCVPQPLCLAPAVYSQYYLKRDPNIFYRRTPALAEGAWRDAVHGVLPKSRTWLSDFTFTHWRRKRQPTPVFFPGESQGQGSLVGCCLWGRTVGHDWSNLAAAAAATYSWIFSSYPCYGLYAEKLQFSKYFISLLMFFFSLAKAFLSCHSSYNFLDHSLDFPVYCLNNRTQGNSPGN